MSLGGAWRWFAVCLLPANLEERELEGDAFSPAVGTVLISVVIPVKDRLEALKACVASLFVQTVAPFEIIIVDDFSVVPITQSFFEAPSGIRLTIMRNEPNIGSGPARNRGVEFASGSVIAFLDSDDAFAPTYIQEVEAFWRKANPETVCVATGFWWCTNDLRPYKMQTLDGEVLREDLLERGNFVGGCSVLSVAKKGFQSAGGFPVARGADDWGMLLRVSLVGKIFCFGSPLVYYRSPSASALTNLTKDYIGQAKALASLAREQPWEDRKRFRKFRHSAICSVARQSRRTTVFWKLWSAYVKTYGLDHSARLILLPALFGSRVVDDTLRRFASMRSKLYRRRLRRTSL